MYEENQTFKWSQQLFWGITLMTFLPLLIFYKKEDGLLALAIVGFVLLLTGGLFFSMKQTIRIDEQGVHLKQRPLINNFKSYPWSTIQNWELLKISPIKDFGGWGIRYTGSKTGYIMEGDYGLELDIGKKKKIVLSVKNRAEVERMMKKYSSRQ